MISNSYFSTVYGVWRDKRHLMVPWLLVQGLLGLLLAGLALYYLIIFPDKSNCMPHSVLSRQEKAVKHQYHPHQVLIHTQKKSFSIQYHHFTSDINAYNIHTHIFIFRSKLPNKKGHR